MPLFEFQCKECGAHFEELIRNGEDGKCPKCGSENVERLMSQVAEQPGGGGNRLPEHLLRGGGAKFEMRPTAKTAIAPKPAGGSGFA